MKTRSSDEGPAFASIPVKVVGHEQARAALEAELPGCTLLTGPAGVGRRTLAEYVVRHHEVAPVDVRWLAKPDAAAARELLTWSARAPMSSPLKVAVLRLDGAQGRDRWVVSPAALNALLKLLEEPPAAFRAVLLATGRPLDTIVSRSHLWRLAPLSEDELFAVLTGLGETALASREAARAAAGTCGGTVHAALAALAGAGDREKRRSVLAPVWTAVGGLDAGALAEAAGALDEDAGAALVRWLHEALTGRWHEFGPGDCRVDPGKARDRAMLTAMLTASGTGARTSLTLRTGWCDAVARRRTDRDRGL